MDELRRLKVRRIIKDEARDINDSVIVEYPLTVFINDMEFVTVHCTPSSLINLSVGFLYSEGIINERSDIENIRLEEERGMVFVYTKEKDVFMYKGDKLFGKKTVTTACGRSKTVSYGIIDFLGTRHEKLVNSFEVKSGEVINLMNSFNKRSGLFMETGGAHSCALCDRDKIIKFEEDVGRHNALDKIIGYMLTEGIDPADKIIMTSGRISSEMFIKVLKIRIPVLVSRSAPTNIAVESARKFNLTLIGFVRGEKINVYTNFHLIQIP
jgi:FdhD protein